VEVEVVVEEEEVEEEARVDLACVVGEEIAAGKVACVRFVGDDDDDDDDDDECFATAAAAAAAALTSP
jgi:hypothetical protein